MSAAPIVGFFNNKGGVGKTTLVYHLAWKYADLGERVLAIDLDPQANLSAAFLEEDKLEELWDDRSTGGTIYDALRPLVRGIGDISAPHVEQISIDNPLFDPLGLLVGDLELSEFEGQLSEAWPKAGDGEERAFRVLSSFWRLIRRASQAHEATIVLVDLGPNLGAINRSVLIAIDHIVVPLSPDLFSLQGLRNLGPTLRNWRNQWTQRREKNPASDLDLPRAAMNPLGYVVLQHSVRLDRPVKAFEKWIRRIPSAYRRDVLNETGDLTVPMEEDRNCLHLLKNYRSLMPMAQEARKPIFHLQSADGAIGGHLNAVARANEDFERLARTIQQRIVAEEGKRAIESNPIDP